jgi:hypothetical protein
VANSVKSLDVRVPLCEMPTFAGTRASPNRCWGVALDERMVLFSIARDWVNHDIGLPFLG